MIRLNSNVSTAKAALKQRPEVLYSVRVYPSVDVSLRMVHNVMDKVVAYLVVSHSVIGIDLGTILDVLEHDILQGLALDVRNHCGTNLSKVPGKDALYYRFAAVESALLIQAQLARLVHVLCESANEGLIRFQFRIRSDHLPIYPERAIVKRRAQTLKHEPRRLLSNSKSAVNLHTRDTVLAIDKHPESDHPLIESERRILKDRVDLERELLITAATEPEFARLDEVVFLRATTRTMDVAIRPAKANGVLEGTVRIGEINYGFL